MKWLREKESEMAPVVCLTLLNSNVSQGSSPPTGMDLPGPANGNGEIRNIAHFETTGGIPPPCQNVFQFLISFLDFFWFIILCMSVFPAWMYMYQVYALCL